MGEPSSMQDCARPVNSLYRGAIVTSRSTAGGPMRRRRSSQAVLEMQTVDILSEIARRYYLRDESQIEIARDLGLDPSTVSRHLKRARDEGIVHVEIRTPRRPAVDLGLALAQRYGLARVVVSPDVEGPEDDPDQALAATAAAFIEGVLVNNLRLGVSWGRTLADVVHHLRPGTVSRLVDRAARRGRGGSESGDPGPRAGAPAGRALSRIAGPLPPRAGDRRIGRRRFGADRRPDRAARRWRPRGPASSPWSASARWTTWRRCAGEAT